VSEYQSYEFVALDRPLTAKQMDALRAISARAEISPTRFWNEYQWGDLKADPAKLMARYFDAHLYFANWGTHRLMLRIPKARVDRKALAPYFVGKRAARLTSTGEHLLLDFLGDTEEPDYDDPIPGSLATLSQVRSELMRGDLRPAYLAWLLAVCADDLDEDDEEPPVPAGLAKLTPAQEGMVEFLRIDVDLVAAAGSGSAAITEDDTAFRRWVAALPLVEKDAWLRRAADEPDLALGGELQRAFRASRSSTRATRAVTKADRLGARRTVGELRALAEVQRGVREKAAAAAARAKRSKAAAGAARQRHLTKLARDVEAAWSKLEKLVEARDYEPALKLAVDLRDIATKDATSEAFARRFEAMRKRRPRRREFFDRWKRVKDDDSAEW
jgi:hypothetical protein